MRRGRGDDDKEALYSSELVKPLPDTQSEPAELAVDAGISDLRMIYQNGKVGLPVTLAIQTSTGLHRGVHMSRLVHAASVAHDSLDMVSWLRHLCREVNKSQPGSHVTCRFDLPYADQFVPVSIRASEAGMVSYQFTARGMTACPCSKAMTGVGHMQRAELVMMLRSRKQVDMVKVVGKLEECFSAVPTEKMKRPQEAKKILEAQEHARFAEDLARECVKRFPNALFVKARCFESIHAHDAVATWSSKPGWIPDA